MTPGLVAQTPAVPWPGAGKARGTGSIDFGNERQPSEEEVRVKPRRKFPARGESRPPGLELQPLLIATLPMSRNDVPTRPRLLFACLYSRRRRRRGRREYLSPDRAMLNALREGGRSVFTSRSK